MSFCPPWKVCGVKEMFPFRVFIAIAVWLSLMVYAVEEGGSYDEVFYFGGELDEASANERILSELLVPLRVRLSSDEEVRVLTQILLFADEKRGVCPRVDTGDLLREVFRLSPALEKTYGERRLSALQSLLLSSSFFGVKNTTLSESFGQIIIELPMSREIIPVHLGDMHVKFDTARRPSIQLNIVAHALRRRRAEISSTYLKDLRETHATLRRIHYNAIVEEHQHRREAYQRYQKHLAMMNELKEFKKSLGESAATRGRPVVVVEFDSGSDTNGGRPPLTGSFFSSSSTTTTTTRCLNVRHAVATLRNQSVVSTEGRMRYLLAAEEKACGTSVVANPSFSTSEEEGMCDCRCLSYCDGVAELQNWAARTGSTLSTAQVHALYHSILEGETGANRAGEKYFSRLRQLVVDDVDRGVFSTCAGLCIASPGLLAEKKFFAGVIMFLDEADLDAHPEAREEEEEEKVEVAEVSQAWWYRAQMGYLYIWEAAHTGSRSAIAALATMKEHGMVSSRQTQVAVSLLHAALFERRNHFWRQIMSVEPSESLKALPPTEKLLRYERFFALDNSWSLVNEPYITRERLNAFRIELDEADGDKGGEELGAPTQVSSVVRWNVFRAVLCIAGIKGIPRDLQRAECLLLTVLRRLRYACDVSHAEEHDMAYFSHDGRGGGCDEHLEKLRLLRRSGVPMGECGPYNQEGGAKQPLRFRQVVHSKKAHSVLHDTLVLLSYIQLLNGVKHHLAAKYAFLALKLGAAAFHRSLVELDEDAEQQFHAAREKQFVNASLLRGKVWSVEALLTHAMQRGEPNDALLDFTRSGFLSSESLVLLAMSAFRSGMEGEQYMRVAVESFFGTRPCVEEGEKAPCRVQWTFYLLREAARLWRDEKNHPGILYRSYPSPQRADPFLLMASLLQSGQITVADIRYGDLFTSPRYAPGASHFLRPSASDTCSTYSVKLVRFAQTVSPLTTLRRRVGVYKKNWQHFVSTGVSLRELYVLRSAMQNNFEEHNMNPLLVTSDVHYYLDDTRWTLLQRLFNGIWEGILSLFAKTRADSLEEQFAREILPENPRGSNPAGIAERLAASVLNSRHVRVATIALQLLPAALMSGEPDGFTLMLIEEMERGNVHLRSFVQFLSEQLWGHTLDEVWMEAHKTAQWHHARPLTRGEITLFAINQRHTFRYALPESKMELFTQIALKRVMNRQRHTASRNATSPRGSLAISEEANNEIMHALALCSGVLIDVAMRKGRPFVPRNPYDGMHFPVGSPLCLRRFLEHVRATRISPFYALNAESLELSLVNLLANLTAMQSLYYNLLDAQDHPWAAVQDKEEHEEGRRIRKHLVEPWRRVSESESEELPLPGLGEGAFYNSRLHRVTGIYYAARIHILYMRAKQWLASIVGLLFW